MTGFARRSGDYSLQNTSKKATALSKVFVNLVAGGLTGLSRQGINRLFYGNILNATAFGTNSRRSRVHVNSCYNVDEDLSYRGDSARRWS